MNKKVLFFLLFAILSQAGVHAREGYLTDSAGQIVRNVAGECWHTGYWTPAMAVAGCDGVDNAVVQATVEDPVIVTEPVYFAFDDASLSGQAIAKLYALAAKIRTNAVAGRLVLSGHADHIGTENYNLGLSKHRAEAVRNYLVQRIDSAISVEIIAKGETQAVVACPDASGDALIRCLAPNRRVEIDVYLTGS